MGSRSGGVLVLLGLVLAVSICRAEEGEEDLPGQVPPARQVVKPIAPELPAEVVSAMQEARFAEAVAALERLGRDPKAVAEDLAYYALIRGIAHRLARQLDEARTVLRAAIEAAPQGPWAAKLRGELAAVELASGRFAEAEALARAEVAAVLDHDRKDRLAEVYRGFARVLLAPAEPARAPDFAAAYALLAEARPLARSEPLRALLLFEMARAAQEQGNPAKAVEDFQAYLKEHPTGADRFAARFHFGEALLASGGPSDKTPRGGFQSAWSRESVQARLTWTDLARDLRESAERDATAADLRARALYQIARTYGVPAPPDDASLALGVAALRRFLEAYPRHPLAATASYEIGASFLARGQGQPALEALRAFLEQEGDRDESDEARKTRLSLAMAATFQVGKIQQGQEQFDAAIASWRGYLAQFPNGPRSAEAQRAILDTQLLIAADLLRREEYAKARAAWEAFVAQNPLDVRAPQVLNLIGESFATEAKWDEAIAAWEALAGKFPGTEPAARALYRIAGVTEAEKHDPAAALERFRQVTASPWRDLAQQAIAAMQARSLTVVTPRAFRSGETPLLKITTRNVDALSFRAYRLDAEAYFRKKQALKRVEALDIALVAPGAEWTATVPGAARYTLIEAAYELKPLAVPGVWVVRVTGGETLQATTLVLGSDLDAIVKASRDQVLAFAQDMKTGRPRPGARVLIADGSGEILETKAGGDGVVLKFWDRPRAPAAALEYLIIDGPDVAGSGLGLPQQVAQGLSPRAYLYTDRPAYRPGQEVRLRGVVREVREGQYDPAPGMAYRLEITDSRGRRIVSREVTLSEFGTFHERVPIDDAAPVGTYRVRLSRPPSSEFSGRFEVQAYKLEKADLSVALPQTVSYRGETIRAEVIARTQFGSPLAGRPIAVALPDGRVLRGATDAAGKYPVAFGTEEFAEEQDLRIVAELPQDGVSAVAVVRLAVQAFRIDLRTGRTVYLSGEAFELGATTLDARGEPTGQDLAVSLLKRTEQIDRVTEREVAREALKTDRKTGRGSVLLKVEDEQGGSYVARVAGTDRFGNPVVSEHALTISGAEDQTRLRLLADRTSWKVGETARVNLHNRSGEGLALVAWEADRILSYRLVPLREGDNPIAWEAAGAQFPNFTLTAARMSGTAFHTARLDIALERDLRVTVAPGRPEVGPGEEVTVAVTTQDQLGRPVAAELSLALVDRALLRLYGDRLPPIGPFFHDQARTGAFETEATNTFRYTPETVAVNAAVVERDRRQQAEAADAEQARMVVPGFTKVEAMSRAGITPRFDWVDGVLVRGVLDQRTLDVLNQLAQPVPMPFPDETPLEDVIKYLKSAARGPDGKGIPIYVDPVGLTEAEKTMQSPVAMDVEGVPLRTTLRNLLSQLGLDYHVEDGLLTITSQSAHAEGEAIEFGMKGMGGGGFGGMGGMGGGISDGGGFGGGGFGGGGELPARSPSRPAVREAEPEPEAPRMKDVRAVEGKGVRGEPAAPPPPPREVFVETAYWNPRVVTGPDGTARVTFRAPTALSQYQFTARGVTGTDTLAGQATADLAVRQDVFVDLRYPSTLIQGDRPRFLARLHHRGVVGPAAVKLVIYAGGREEVYPHALELKADGVEEILFEPFEVPDGDVVRLTLSATSGGKSDEMTAEVPIRPWGVQAFASASGTGRDDATVLVGLPPGREYESPEMLIVLTPTVQRMLIELALGRDAYPLDRRVATCLLPASARTVGDRASDLLAATAVMGYLRSIRAGDEAGLLTGRIQALVSELIGLQNDDGGWPWVAGRGARPSERMTSARVVWALASAEPFGLLSDPKALEQATTYLTQQFARVDAADHEGRAALLHALSLRGQARFEMANALNRARQDLPDTALAYLALTLARLDRAALAGEVLGVLGPRAQAEPAGLGRSPRMSWGGAGPGSRNDAVEATALTALAYATVRPQAPELAAAVSWLQEHRLGTGWQPHAAVGPAVAALASYHGGGQAAEDRYRLVVTVNDAEVYHAEVAGQPEGRALVVPRKVLKVGGQNRVHFDIEGRGTFGFAVTLTGFARDFGPDQEQDGRTLVVAGRDYLAAEPELDGRALPSGFRASTGATFFENLVTQVAPGGRARVAIRARRDDPADQPSSRRDFLILEEHLPAGASLVEGSVQGTAAHYELADGVLTFYFSPDQHPGDIRYDIHGYLPGRYRVLPTRLRSASDPGRSHLGPVGAMEVLAPGAPATDPYRPTPDELYARGKALFDAGRTAEAGKALEDLFDQYKLRDEVLKEVARMLLHVHLDPYRPRQIVRDFEVVREKLPELFLPFDKLLVIGRAYADIGEHERAYLGWAAAAEASYLEDARLGAVLRQRGNTLAGIAFLQDLWRQYPDVATIQGEPVALAQLLAGLAGRATTDPPLRQELAEAGLTRSDLRAQAIRLLRTFLAQAPTSPVADEASLSLVSEVLELEDYRQVVELAGTLARIYPRSTFLDDFRYAEALGQFHLAQYDRAIDVAGAIARASNQDAGGVEQPGPNQWRALYILAQIHDARGEPAEALAYYRQVADRFSDAADAVDALTLTSLTLPEVSVLRPGKAADAKDRPSIRLETRNIAEARVTVYPVDLARLYLERRHLDAIAGVDLAGITPLVETTVRLGPGLDFRDRSTPLDLPLEAEGAYLVMVRGGALHASGIVLVTGLDLEVREQTDRGRVRITARDATRGAAAAGVQVDVIGSDNAEFISGRTDLRGVFVAEGARGQVTAVARRGSSGYAFYRGTARPGTPARQPAAAGDQQGRPATLGETLRDFNDANQRRQLDQLERRSRGPGGFGGMGGGGFR